MDEEKHIRFCSSVVEKILEMYPNQAADAPEAYAEGLIRLLAEYPAGDVEQLLHPRHGLAAQCRFLPTVAEAKEMLDAAAEERRQAQEREYRRLTDRRQIEDLMAARREREEFKPDPEIIRRMDELRRNLRATAVEHKLRKRG